MATARDGEIGRRRFLASVSVLGVPLATGALPDAGWSADERPEATLHGADLDDGPPPATGSPRAPFAFPRNDLARVESVVGASHGNFERVRELVLEQPALAKASWDWGFGDWETPLGAASHTGRREIAALLIAHGARPTLFSAAMLGQVDAVRALLSSDPGLFRLHGPHGISLTRHALAGGPDAERVVDYLRDRFGPDEEPFGHPGDDEVEARFGGRYRFDTDPPAIMSVGVRNQWLMFGTGEQPTARVLEVEEDVFHPTGAPAVRLRFEVVDGRAEAITVEDGPVVIRGRRVADHGSLPHAR
jgi:hypothetical protein